MSDRDVAARIDAVRRSLAAGQPSSGSAHGNKSAAIVDQAPSTGAPARGSAACEDQLESFSNFSNFDAWDNFDNFSNWTNFVNFADWIH